MAESLTRIQAHNHLGESVTILQRAELIATAPRGTVLMGRQPIAPLRYTTESGAPLNEPEMNGDGKRIWRALESDESFVER